MFKLQQLVYKAEFTQGNGFTPYRDDVGYHAERALVAKPFKWRCGYAITFEIEDSVFSQHECDCGKTLSIGSDSKKIDELIIYDKDQTAEMALLIQVVGTNEVRGDYANSMVAQIFFTLCDEFARKYLPELMDFRDKIKQMEQKNTAEPSG